MNIQHDLICIVTSLVNITYHKKGSKK